MRIFVQLGWIQDLINLIFDKLLNPVFKWVASLLSDAFKWIFDNVLGPILEVAFSIFAQTIGKLIMRMLGRYLYIVEKSLLYIVDMMQDFFNVLAGVRHVTDASLGFENISLLQLLIRSPFMVSSMGIVILISVILVFFSAILAAIRSIVDMGGQNNNRTVSQVMRNLAHALLRMITAPVMGLFLVFLGEAVLVAVTNAMTLGENVTIARSLFVISTLDAVEDEYGAVDKYGVEHGGGNRLKLSFQNSYVSASTNLGDWDNPLLGYNYSTRPQYLAAHPGSADDYGLKDMFREPFYTGAKDFYNTEVTEKTFNFGRMNFLVGIGGALLYIYILGSALFVFVSRMFDILVLLILEPFFLAPMPLDDGETFKKWEDMFIAKIFSGYGMVVAMYLYLLVCSIVFEGKISFTPGDGTGDIMIDLLMKLVLLYGGAATMMTAGPLVTSILNSVAAGQEAQAFQTGQAFTNVAMKPLRFATEKAVLGGARFFTGGKRGLVGQMEKAYHYMQGSTNRFVSKLSGKAGGGPGGGPGGFPGGTSDAPSGAFGMNGMQQPMGVQIQIGMGRNAKPQAGKGDVIEPSDVELNLAAEEDETTTGTGSMFGKGAVKVNQTRAKHGLPPLGGGSDMSMKDIVNQSGDDPLKDK